MTLVGLWNAVRPNRGRWSNVGPVLRANMFRKFVDARGIYGKVKLRAQHSGIGSVVPAEQAVTEIYRDVQSPTLNGFKFINAKTKPRAADGYVQSPAVAHFDTITDDVPWDKFQHRVMIDGGEPQISFNNNFQITLSEGRHSYRANVTDGCNRSCTFYTGDIVVDNTPPTLSINKPLENQTFKSNSSINVEIFIGDMLSGVRSVDLYLDRVGGTPYARFRGPWMIGNVVSKDSISINIRESGTHKIFILAEDRAGNIQKISRVIQVQAQPSSTQPLNRMQKTIK